MLRKADKSMGPLERVSGYRGWEGVGMVVNRQVRLTGEAGLKFGLLSLGKESYGSESSQ